MKKLLFVCMVLASVFVLVGCSKAPTDEEGKEYIRKVLTAHGREFLKMKYHTLFLNGKFEDHSSESDDIYDLVEIISISDGVDDRGLSLYYNSPAKQFRVSIKYNHRVPFVCDFGEKTAELNIAVIKDKKTGALSLTECYKGENSKRW